MKKIKLITLCMAMSIGAMAQNVVTKNSDGDYVSLKTQREFSPPKPMGGYFVDSKGKKYPIFISAKGRMYYERTSAKTQKVYKVYIKEEGK
jgi:hypothetical protein